MEESTNITSSTLGTLPLDPHILRADSEATSKFMNEGSNCLDKYYPAIKIHLQLNQAKLVNVSRILHDSLQDSWIVKWDSENSLGLLHGSETNGF